MEQIPSAEKVAAIDLDSYLEALPLPDFIEGKMMEDASHTFYFWLSKYYPAVGVVDGVTLEDLYLKNVIETGMTEADFLQYCDRNQLPIPPMFQNENQPSFYNINFLTYLDRQNELQNEQYEKWAQEHGIATVPGSVMRFVDNEGYEYRVRTDTANRGQIIA